MPRSANPAAFISTAPATSRERKLASAAILISLIGFAVTAECARRHAERRALTVRTERVDLDDSDATAEAIPAEIQKHAFEPFFTTTGVERGTGPGLSQIYGFVNRSGGHIRLTGRIGQGTTIKMYLTSMAIAETSKTEATLSVSTVNDSSALTAPGTARRPADRSVGGQIAA